jgi:hypothetical protein
MNGRNRQKEKLLEKLYKNGLLFGCEKLPLIQKCINKKYYRLPKIIDRRLKQEAPNA